MRADLITIQQTLTPEAATVLNQSIAEATRRNHGHTTPLHVAATLLSSSSGFLRQACIKSHPNSSHPLQCRALELCFSVALERLPTTTTTTSSPSQPQEPPLLSNALTAALKRAQAHQRRGCPEQQQQPLLAVKVELEQLIISILDDPSVSRVMREASFSSPAVKSAIEQSRFGNSRTVNQSAIGFGYRPVPVPVNRNPYLNLRFQQNEHSGQRSIDEEAKRVVEIMTRTRKRNPVLVGDSEPRVIVKEILGKIENGDGPLRNFQVIRLEEELASSSTRFGEISGLVETRLGNSELTGGVVLDLGDLKWLAANGGGGGAVVEMRKLLERYKGRLCFIGTATCETYLRCQVYYPSMENDCDLQAIPIAAKSPLPTMFQRFGSSNIISTESISPTRSLQIPTGKMNCCYQCLQSYENDVVKLEKSLTEHNRSVLPQWLQNAKADDVGDKKLTKDQEIVELKKKWNDLCLRLHPKPNSRSDKTPPGSPVGTDLVLGRSNRVVSSPDKKTRDSFDIDLFKKLLKGLAKSVWWQHDAASSVASAITERKHGNGKPKGDIWLMFTGPDKTGKTKMASAIADLVSGSRPITISLGSGSSTDDGSSLRGKTALDRLAETVRRNPFAVIVMEDIDEADVLLRNNVELFSFKMHSTLSTWTILITLACLMLRASLSDAQLTPTFYDSSCPNVTNIVRETIVNELRSDPRIAASILRLHFHDCFVNGCDASILLDNTTSFRTEKDAAGNANSARGFPVIDRMKAAVERACPRTVSCADMLTIAAQQSVTLAGGPAWRVPLGRRDSLQAFLNLANANLPAPFFTLPQLKASFRNVGLDRPSDLVALSGGHTFGKNQCRFIMDRLYNFSNTGLPDPTLNTTYLQTLRGLCPRTGNLSALVDFDLRTPTVFDNKYYVNLREQKGLIQSDQELFSSPNATDTIPLVRAYADGTQTFFNAFVEAMNRMGNITPLTGTQGQIRLNCRMVNSNSLLHDVVDIVDFVSSM